MHIFVYLFSYHAKHLLSVNSSLGLAIHNGTLKWIGKEADFHSLHEIETSGCLFLVSL